MLLKKSLLGPERRLGRNHVSHPLQSSQASDRFAGKPAMERAIPDWSREAEPASPLGKILLVIVWQLRVARCFLDPPPCGGCGTVVQWGAFVGMPRTEGGCWHLGAGADSGSLVPTTSWIKDIQLFISMNSLVPGVSNLLRRFFDFFLARRVFSSYM
jgi:hypothetical protein